VIKGLTLRHVYIANAALVGMLLSVGLGFFLGREFPAAPAVSPAPRPQLPPGVTQLPQGNFQAWALNCLQNAQGNKRCQLTMRAFDPKQKGVVLQLVAARGGSGKPFLAIMTPSNAALPPGVHLALGIRVQQFRSGTARPKLARPSHLLTATSCTS
jgi:invasion protein IalB